MAKNKKMRYVSEKYLRIKMPLLPTAAWPTFCHYWGAPQWVFGAVGFFLLIVWVCFFVQTLNCTPIEEAPFDR